MVSAKGGIRPQKEVMPALNGQQWKPQILSDLAKILSPVPGTKDTKRSYIQLSGGAEWGTHRQFSEMADGTAYFKKDIANGSWVENSKWSELS